MRSTPYNVRWLHKISGQTLKFKITVGKLSSKKIRRRRRRRRRKSHRLRRRKT